jgi:ATP-dependent exoDNAse (exonuclease V) beta subunit
MATNAAAPSSLFPFSVPQDVNERQRALDAGQSFIVQAPAGSGKTELLIQRFLTLLARVDQPEEIVAITFTKKAAAEMRDRVLAALERVRSGEPLENQREIEQRALATAVLERSDERKWDLLRNPGRLRIDTIDALSNAIVRSMPWLSRFGAMPEPVEDAQELYRIAASRTVRMLAEGNGNPDADAIRTLLAHLDVNVAACERLIAQMLSRREQWLRIIVGEDVHALRPVLEANLAQLIRIELQQVQSMLPEIAVRELPRAVQLERLPAADALALSVWKDICDKLLTKSGDWRKKASGHEGAVLEALRLGGDRYEALREALDDLRKLPPPYYEDAQWKVLEALFRALKLAAANLRVVFQSRGQVDFSEITQAALDALGPVEHPTDLALALGHRIRHLLVDEFQDTSNSQRELLLKLTAGWDDGDGRTLFLVGDPMQSIYRFREAEVGVFLDTRSHGLGSLHPEPLTIRVNFRSSPEIVNWGNSCFTEAFPQAEDIAMGAVPFEESVAFRWESGVVRVHPRFDKDDAAEAALVADLIGAAKDENPGQSIAVLVRARSHLRDIVREIRGRGWRYRAVKVDTLAESPVVRDLLALSRALVHLADRPAWLALLRAPWCGLTLADLDAIAGGDHKSTVWTLLRSPGLRLSADGASRLRRFLQAIDPVMLERRRVPLRHWVEGAWIRLGGPACCRSEAELADAREFLQLLDAFDEGGDLPEFDRIEQRLEEIFTNPDPEADDRLQVMTIHQAKGLEFDTVILPGLGKSGRQDDQRLMHWLRNQDRLVLAPVPASQEDDDPIYRYLASVESRKESNELARLLYVAATRARRTLHLIGNVTVKKNGEISKPDRRSLLYRMWPAVSEEFAAEFARIGGASGLVTGNVAGDHAAPAAPRKLRRVASDYATALAVPVPVDTEDAGFTEEGPLEELGQSFDWAGNTLRHIGVVTHACLHRWIREGSGDVDGSEWVREQAGAIRRLLASLGVPAGECGEAAAKVQAAVLRTLEDPRGAWALSPVHAESQSEFALTGRVGSEIIRGVVDRTFVDEEGVRWIIDYKTSTHEGAGLEWFLDHEQTRYRAQLERYGRLFLARESRRVKLGLYFPLLGGWREWELLQ